MIETDKSAFATLMTDALAFYGKDVSRFALDVWWQSCQPFDFDQVARALTRALLLLRMSTIGLALVVGAVPCTGRVIGLLPGGSGCGLRALGCAVAPAASIARALPSATECERVVAVRRPVPVMANVVSMLPCNFE